MNPPPNKSCTEFLSAFFPDYGPYSDYPTKPIGGDNPYQCCASCGVSDPQINGTLSGHRSDCEWVCTKKAELLLTSKKVDRMGHSPASWAAIITVKITAENPLNSEEAEKIYAEIIHAAVDQERLFSALSPVDGAIKARGLPPMPVVEARQPADDRFPRGYPESLDDWYRHNQDAVEWFLDNADKIRALVSHELP